jgi:anti-sigma B factor antagonist
MASPSSEWRPEVNRISDEVFVHLPYLTRLLDEGTVRIFREFLTTVAEEPDTRMLSLDLLGIEYLNSAALWTLVQVHQKLKSRGGRFVLCNVSPQIYEVFNVTKLNEQLEIHKPS